MEVIDVDGHCCCSARFFGSFLRVTAHVDPRGGSPIEVHWTIVHIKDDIGSLLAVLFLTNGLLAAILGVLILRAL